MAGKYLIGVDGGTQSTKVVIYDLGGDVVCEGARTLLPMEHPQPGYAVHPDDDLWDSIVAASREAMMKFPGDHADIVGVGLCTIRCCKAFLKADGSLLEPVMSWMDTRAYQPYLPDDPELAWATTSSGYLTHRFTGEFRDSAANNVILQWPIDTDTWEWDSARLTSSTCARICSSSCRCRVTSPATSLPMRRRRPAYPEGLPVVTTANDKAVEALGSGALDETRPHLTGHVHRLDDARPREPPGRRRLLDQLRLRAAPLSLRERRRAPRHVDAQLVPRPARAPEFSSSAAAQEISREDTSSARPSSSRPVAAA